MSDIDRSGAALKEARSATKTSSGKLNPVLRNNRYVAMDFPDYEFAEYPKAIAVPVPMNGATPDEDDMPPGLQRKVRERYDESGQVHQMIESDKAWLKRVTRAWSEHWPIAANAAEEAKIKKEWGLDKPKVEAKQ
jgi:hypothetical protein